MKHILDILQNDLRLVVRDRKVFVFTLVMPIAFTLLLGYAFGGFGGGVSDSRLPVAYLDADRSRLSAALRALLAASPVIRLVEYAPSLQPELEAQVDRGELAAVVLVPRGYAHDLLHGKAARFELVVDAASASGVAVKSAALTAANRLDSAVHTALILEGLAGELAPFDYALEQALQAWQPPPIQVQEIVSQVAEVRANQDNPLAHTSPGMMLQFSIAGLVASAQIIVNERKSRCLRRLFTTRARRTHILLGHYLAILTIACAQFFLLISFGQFILGVNYSRQPPATLLVAFSAALCVAALGLLIGALAKSDEQAVVFALIPMFVFAGLGGAWVPLEVTGETFQAIGHLSPIAWGMDGFKSILLRGQGLEAVWLPATMLAGYTLLFFSLAAWRFQVSQE
jgi:ABC-2 type transport system permease protein